MKPKGLAWTLLLAVFARPNLRSFPYENGQGVAFHVDDCSLFVGLEVFDPAQVTVCNRLTDVDQPFSVHLFQSLLWQMGEDKPLLDEFVLRISSAERGSFDTPWKNFSHVLGLWFFLNEFKINPYQRKYNHATYIIPIKYRHSG